jgi:hypothetical protein
VDVGHILLRDAPPLASTWSLHVNFILYLTSSKRDIVPCEHIIDYFIIPCILPMVLSRKWF